MTKKRFTLFAIVMAAFVLFVGCKKEKTEEKNPSASEACVGMLHFNSAEEFRETQEKVLAMSETERREWERQQGFKSYATKCYELLEELEKQGITTDEDVFSFAKTNSKYFYIQEENGEKSLKCYLFYTPYFYLANEDRLLSLTENLCMKIFEEGVVFCSIDYLEQLKNIDSFSERLISDNMAFVQLNRNYHPLIENLSRTDEFNILGNGQYYKGLRATRKNWKEGNRNNIELLETEVYYPPTDATPGQYITNIYIYNYPEHRVAGLWYPCQRRKNFDVTVTWKTKINGVEYSHTGNYTAVDDGGYNTTRGLELIPLRIDDYSFELFQGTAYTYDTPYMVNFDSSQSDFGL
jgi:hypothetical protein